MKISPVPLDTVPATRRRLLTTVALAGPAAGSALLAACASEAAPAATDSSSKPAAVPPTPPPPTATPLPPTPTPVPKSALTGKVVADAAKIQRRIVGVKIDNAPLARPQLGLGVADMVYEQLAEGGLTRFLAFFLEQEPERAGPVRSARLTDIYLAQEWDFLLAYAGAGRTTGRLLAEALIPLFKAPELAEPLAGTPYLRDNSRPVPHNLFVKVAQMREEARKDAGIAQEVFVQPLPFFDPTDEVGPVRSVNLPYIPYAAVSWRYDLPTNMWRRIMAGVPHVDALTGQQVQADNIVVQFAKIFTATNVEPDAAGNPVLDADLRGENRLVVFHSGIVFEGFWRKPHDRAKTEYRLHDGAPMPFRPGRTWIHIVPEEFRLTWA